MEVHNMNHKSNQEEDDDEERVQEWETGLPTSEDLTPLSHQLISLQLASAFSISAEPFQTMLDVNRASQNTLTNLRRQSSAGSNNFKVLSSFMEDRCSDPDPVVVDEEEDGDFSDKRKIQCVESIDDADSALRMENFNDDCSARTLKRARLVWTPQLHKRFVEVVAHLGIDNSVPKTIMQLMNVEGLTRENVASHLQKYRLYLKRMNDGGSSSDIQLFTPAPVNQQQQQQSVPSESKRLPLPPVQMVGPSHMGMQMQNSASGGNYNGFQFHPYSMYREHQGHWSGGNQFNSVVPHSHHVTPNDN